jgi:hypothetical protein
MQLMLDVQRKSCNPEMRCPGLPRPIIPHQKEGANQSSSSEVPVLPDPIRLPSIINSEDWDQCAQPSSSLPFSSRSTIKAPQSRSIVKDPKVERPCWKVEEKASYVPQAHTYIHTYSHTYISHTYHGHSTAHQTPHHSLKQKPRQK